MSGSISGTTAAYIAAAAAIAAAGTTAYSAVAAGENAKETADYNAKVQENAAKDATERGAIAAAEQRDKTRQMIARQNAAMSSSGIDTSTGSALDIQTETAGMGELDALRIVNNAQRQAAGLQAQADLERFKGSAAQTAGYFNAAGSVLGGLGSAANSYYGATKGSGSGGSSVNYTGMGSKDYTGDNIFLNLK